MSIFRLSIISFSLTLLIACGGGSSGGSSNSPSTLSASGIWNVLRDRAARADTYFVDAYGKDPSVPSRIIEPTRGITCSGVDCSYELGFRDLILRVDINPQEQYPNEPLPQSIPTFSLDAEITGRTDNITFFRFSTVSIGSGGSETFQDYGGWMNSSVFGVTKEIYDYPEDTDNQFIQFSHSEFYGFSFGNSPGTNPAGTGRAEWRGAMIGVKEFPQNVVRGDVSVDIDNLDSPDVDVNIFNIIDTVTNDRVMPNGETNFGWDDLDLANGRFDSRDDIKGSFYGGNHEEVGGVFHIGRRTVDGITGAFGATRQ